MLLIRTFSVKVVPSATARLPKDMKAPASGKKLRSSEGWMPKP